MADNVEFLKHVRLFENLDRKSLEAIANAAVEQSYTAGQEVVRQGDTGVGVFIIIPTGEAAKALLCLLEPAAEKDGFKVFRGVLDLAVVCRRRP